MKENDIDQKPLSYYDNTRSEMLPYIPEGISRTLEFGCGSGGFSELLKKNRRVEAWAVEIDRTSAALAQKKLDKVIVCDAADSIRVLPDAHFDCVILLDVLEHLVDPYTFLTSLKSKVTPAGRFIASIPNIRYYRAMLDYVLHGNWDYTDRGILDRTHLRFFTRRSIEKTLGALGFEILVLDGIHPTSSRSFKALNLLTCGRLADARFRQFAVVFQSVK